MANANDNVKLRLSTTGARTAQRDFDATGKSVRGVGRESKETAKQSKLADLSMKGMSGSARRLHSGMGVLLAGAGIASVASGIKGIAVAAADAQASEAKVKNLLTNIGINFDRHKDRIDSVIQAQSQLTGFDDEDLAESFANMARTTGSVNEALKLNTLVADVARTKGTSLGEAQSLLARVYNGSFLGIKRLGIGITPVTKAQDRLKDTTKNATREQKAAAKQTDALATRQLALGLLQKKFGGQAASYGETAAGGYDRMQVAIENVKERLGTALLPTLTRVGNKIADFLNEMQTGTGTGGEFARKMAHAGRTLDKYLRPPVEWMVKHRGGVAKFVASFVALAAALKTIRAITKAKGFLTGLTGSKTGGKGGVLGKLMGGVGERGSRTNPMYVIELKKPDKIKNIITKAASVATAAETAAGTTTAITAGLAGSAAVMIGGVAYLAATHNENYATKGQRGASAATNPAGHVPFNPGASSRRAMTPDIDPRALTPLPARTPASDAVRGKGNSMDRTPFVVQSIVHLDGKEVARSTARHANKRAALK